MLVGPTYEVEPTFTRNVNNRYDSVAVIPKTYRSIRHTIAQAHFSSTSTRIYYNSLFILDIVYCSRQYVLFRK